MGMGAAVAPLLGQQALTPLPPGFDIIVADGFLNATVGFGSEPLFSVPIGAVGRAQLLRSGGANTSLWSLLCGCCYGERQSLLALDFDAPLGWIQWQEVAGHGIAGPVRLGLHVLDADEYLDAMGLMLDPSPRK